MNAIVDKLLDALVTALPYVEDAAEDPCYKPGAVKKVVTKIKEAISNAEAVSDVRECEACGDVITEWCRVRFCTKCVPGMVKEESK